MYTKQLHSINSDRADYTFRSHESVILLENILHLHWFLIDLLFVVITWSGIALTFSVEHVKQICTYKKIQQNTKIFLKIPLVTPDVMQTCKTDRIKIWVQSSKKYAVHLFWIPVYIHTQIFGCYTSVWHHCIHAINTGVDNKRPLKTHYKISETES